MEMNRQSKKLQKWLWRVKMNVLILTASTGGGHIRASNALKNMILLQQFLYLLIRIKIQIYYQMKQKITYSLGIAYYDIDEYTDQTLRQLVEETIREKALRLLDDEVPHGIYVETQKMKLRKTQTKKPIYDVEATIYCLRNSHKGIIIGKNGQMLKRIGTYAREDLEKVLDTKINLQLWVKVREDWINDDSLVKKFKLQ